MPNERRRKSPNSAPLHERSPPSRPAPRRESRHGVTPPWRTARRARAARAKALLYEAGVFSFSAFKCRRLRATAMVEGVNGVHFVETKPCSARGARGHADC
jgi:hypothetical protein